MKNIIVEIIVDAIVVNNSKERQHIEASTKPNDVLQQAF